MKPGFTFTSRLRKSNSVGTLARGYIGTGETPGAPDVNHIHDETNDRVVTLRGVPCPPRARNFAHRQRHRRIDGLPPQGINNMFEVQIFLVRRQNDRTEGIIFTDRWSYCR